MHVWQNWQTRGSGPFICTTDRKSEAFRFFSILDELKEVRNMFSQADIWKIAMEQSAWDNNCRPEDFSKNENAVVSHRLEIRSRKYLREPIACNFISYGGNLVASVKDEYRAVAEEYIGKFEYFHCFETPNLHWLNDRLVPMGQKVCFMAEYFLPDLSKLRRLPCRYKMRILAPADFESLYLPQWSNALCEDRKELDVIGMGAYDGEKLVGFAGASADGEEMWQIGIDVLPEYRRQGIASALTSGLAVEILERGKVPFYCCAWSNIASARNAVKSGFVPAWAEMTVKPSAKVDGMNK